MENGYEKMNIQWFPGHMTKAQRMIEDNVKLVDAVCEILDARIPFSSRNPDIDRLAAGKPQLAAHHAAQPFALEQQRHLVERGRRGVLDHAVWLHVAEQRDLAADILGDGTVGADDQHIGLDAFAEQLLNRVLRGLALQLAAARDAYDQRNVNI